ncbi:MAG TPA: GxxExxY protein [Tepidisphaeraceae bacterium]|nr:GxxExxY protein [Tepidisphaeraceae bacterium]
MDTNNPDRDVRNDLLLKDEVYAVVGASMEVHNQLASSYSENIYQESMEIELELRGIPFEAQKPLPVFYKGRRLKSHYVADLLCFGTLLVELKVIPVLGKREESQVLYYPRATGLRVGLLINYGDPVRLDWHRYVR